MIQHNSINSEYSYTIDTKHHIVLIEESACHFKPQIDKHILKLIRDISELEHINMTKYTIARLNSIGDYDIIDDITPMHIKLDPTLMYLHHISLEDSITPIEAINKIIRIANLN